MAQSPLNSRQRDEPAEFNLREWTLKARMISRENSKSRRFSSSYITNFREDSKSYRSNINTSSTASSPGYNLREEIDPSTYSFSSALRAFQERSVNIWECLSPEEGFALNSKWNEAEKYIRNPVSGEVPLECLSAKTRSFRNLTSRITMSAPLIYPACHSRFNQTTSTYDDKAQLHNIIKGGRPSVRPIINTSLFLLLFYFLFFLLLVIIYIYILILVYNLLYSLSLSFISEKNVANILSMDVGVQSKLPDLTWTSSSTPASTSSPKSNAAVAAGGGGANSTPKLKYDKGEMKETDDGKEETEREEEEEIRKTKLAGEKQVRHHNDTWKCRGKIGCLPLRSLWMTKKSDKHKSRNKMIFPLPCYNNNNNNNSGC